VSQVRANAWAEAPGHADGHYGLRCGEFCRTAALFPEIRCAIVHRVNTPLSTALIERERALGKELTEALDRIRTHRDPLFRQLALAETGLAANQLARLSAGEIVYTSTSSWRAAYEELLRGLDFTIYRSVARVRTSSYWRDSAGKRSLRLNYDLLDRGLRIERVLILPELLWPMQAPLPNSNILTWIEEQHYRGIALSLVRESDLFSESDLISDFGIYGERATGEQELDEESRTISFRLSFSEAAVHSAHERWSRIQVFSRPCQEVIDLA